MIKIFDDEVLLKNLRQFKNIKLTTKKAKISETEALFLNARKDPYDKEKQTYEKDQKQTEEFETIFKKELVKIRNK